MYLDAFRLINASRELQRSHIDACINYLRRHRNYMYAHLVFMCENAPGSRGGEMAALVKDLYQHTSMCEFGQNKNPGVPKTPDITQRMTMRMQGALLENAISFAAEFGTYHGVPPEAAKQNFLQQCLAFRWDEKEHKYHGKGEGRRDDMMVAAMMPLYWRDQFETSVDYTDARTKANIEYQQYAM